MELTMYKYRFMGGMLLVLTSALMFFLDIGENPGRIAIGIVGIVLIATSRRKMPKEYRNR